jgi:hypothetical protein
VFVFGAAVFDYFGAGGLGGGGIWGKNVHVVLGVFRSCFGKVAFETIEEKHDSCLSVCDFLYRFKLYLDGVFYPKRQRHGGRKVWDRTKNDTATGETTTLG